MVTIEDILTQNPNLPVDPTPWGENFGGDDFYSSLDLAEVEFSSACEDLSGKRRIIYVAGVSSNGGLIASEFLTKASLEDGTEAWGLRSKNPISLAMYASYRRLNLYRP